MQNYVLRIKCDAKISDSHLLKCHQWGGVSFPNSGAKQLVKNRVVHVF